MFSLCPYFSKQEECQAEQQQFYHIHNGKMSSEDVMLRMTKKKIRDNFLYNKTI